ncbi:hypothetical protein P9112_012705 [Eukaryota sp. TZLM1-RC]
MSIPLDTHSVPLSSSYKTSTALNKDPKLRDSIGTLYIRRVNEGKILLEKSSLYRQSLDESQRKSLHSLKIIEKLRTKYNHAITDHCNRLVAEIKRLESSAIASINQYADAEGTVFRNLQSELNHKRSRVNCVEGKTQALMNKSQSDFIRSASSLFTELQEACSDVLIVPDPPTELPLAIEEGSPALRFLALGLDDPLKYITNGKKKREKKTKKRHKHKEAKVSSVAVGTEGDFVDCNPSNVDTKGQNHVNLSNLISFENDDFSDFSSIEMLPTEEVELPRVQPIINSIKLPDPSTLIDNQSLIRNVEVSFGSRESTLPSPSRYLSDD